MEGVAFSAQVLGWFSRAVQGESHHLVQRPDLLWQQLHNRLQWVGPPVGGRIKELLGAEAERRQRCGSSWINLLHGPRESPALVQTLAGHKGLVSGCAFSPDGAFLISSGWDSTLRVWDRARGTEMAVLAGHSDQITSCSLGFGGELVASSSHDQTVIVWEWRFGRVLRRLSGHEGWVECCALNPNGRSVASTGNDATVRLWDLDTGREIAGLYEGVHYDYLTFSPDGAELLVASGQVVELWTASLDRMVATLRHAESEGSITSAGFSPDGRLLATTTNDGTLTVWSLAEKRSLIRLAADQDHLNVCAFSPDGRHLATGSGNRFSGRESDLSIWEVGSWKRCARLRGHADSVESCAFAPEGGLIASASADRTIKLWRWEESPAEDERARSTFAYHAEFSPDGRRLACAHRGGLVLRDGGTGGRVADLAGHAGAVYECSFSPGGDLLLTAGVDRTIRLWVPETRTQVRVMADVDDDEFVHFHSCGFSPDGTLIVAVLRNAFNHILHVWDRASGDEIVQVDLDDEPESFTPDFQCGFSPDGSMFVTRSFADLVFRDPLTGEPLRVLPGGTGSYAFSSDGGWVALGGLEKRLALLATDSLRNERHLDLEYLGDHEAGITSCIFSPDGQVLASADAGGTLKAWSVSERRLIWCVRGHSRGVSATAFSPSGELLFSGSHDGTVKLWRTLDGMEVGLHFCLGGLQEMQVDASGRRLACTDSGGNLYLLRLE